MCNVANAMKRGTKGRWFWIQFEWGEGERIALEDIVKGVPEMVVGRCLVNTSFDSGGLGWYEELKAKGWHTVPASLETPVNHSWRIHGPYVDLTHSPRIQSPEEIPFDEFDEWYAFDGPVIINDLRPIVSSSSNPDDGETCVPDFWEKIERYEPALVFGDPGSTMNPWVISRDRELLERIASWGLARGSGCDG